MESVDQFRQTCPLEIDFMLFPDRKSSADGIQLLDLVVAIVNSCDNFLLNHFFPEWWVGQQRILDFSLFFFLIWRFGTSVFVILVVNDPLEHYFKFSVLVAHKGHQKREFFIWLCEGWTLQPFTANLDMMNVQIQIVNLQLGRRHKLWQGFAFDFPVK